MAFLGTNVKVEVEQTSGSAIAVTAVTQAATGEATSAAHGLANGDVVVFTVSAGMVELDQQGARVANVTTNTFELEGLDTTSYSVFTAGTVKKVTAWQTLSGAQSISMPSPAPNKIDITTLIDTSKQYAYGLPDAPDGSINGLFDPLNAAVIALRAATKVNGSRAFRITFAGGQKAVFNALVSAGQGFDMQANAAATAAYSFTPSKDVMYYAA